VVEVVARKTEMLRDHLLATKPFQLTGASDLLTLLSVVTTALSANRDVLRVLDFGGACGAHFFVVKAALGHILNLRWHVVETPAMCDKARALQTDELQFFEHQEHAVAAMDGVDLVYCSGALQYAPDPPAALAELTSHKAQYFLLTRTPVATHNKTVITIQETPLGDNGPGPLPDGFDDIVIRYPMTLVPRAVIESTLGSHYRLLLRMCEAQSSSLSEQTSVTTLACLAERGA
jgi:putative methyltransferase (TIGR04325 family)